MIPAYLSSFSQVRGVCRLRELFVMAGFIMLTSELSRAADELQRYYAHPVAEDSQGVIAPWYKGQNGQFDQRIEIAIDSYKRYPWTQPGQAVAPAPHIVYNTHWSIAADGAITIPHTDPWMCGDLGQRAFSIIRGLTDYYRYTGDPLAFEYIPITVDYILDHCQTPADHPWPRFPLSTPTKGVGYGDADPKVPNQLDLCAYVGLEVLRAYKLIGDERYFESAKHWGDVFAEKCTLTPGEPPWNRYMSPEYMLWSDELTGTTTLIAEFLDALIAMGYNGKDSALVRARDAGRDYVNRQILPRWIDNEAWGRHYWDVEGDWFSGGVVWVCGYFLDHPEAFPQWKNDVRNIMSLVFNRNNADPASRGEAYNGAWAFPESYVCCGTSLSYNQYTYAPTFIQYGELAKDEWAREIGRRMLLMATYDSQENGVVLDGLTGEVVAAAEWLNLAHPWPLCQILQAMGWRPETYAPSRENHLVRSTSVVNAITYDRGLIRYRTFDAPRNNVDVLRLAFEPESISADGKALSKREDLNENGFTLQALPDDDRIVTIRHDGSTHIIVKGSDPQEVAADEQLSYSGEWKAVPVHGDAQRIVHTASAAGAAMSLTFTGNQVRLLGRVDDAGGRADVYIDGAKQMTTLEFWSPQAREHQTLYRKGGLSDGKHELKIVARGEQNPRSSGTSIYVDTVQFSAAKGNAHFGENGGPVGAQRMIFGYTNRKDYVDSTGAAWRPGNEFVIKPGRGVDTIAHAVYTQQRSKYIGKTADPELYRYGLHGKDFRINLTAGPGRYVVRLLFADTNTKSVLRAEINGKEVIQCLKVAEAAGGIFRAYDASFHDVHPRNGILEIHFEGLEKTDACVQAVEIAPERGEP